MQASDDKVLLKVKQLCGTKWAGEVEMALCATSLDLKKRLHEITGQPIATMKLMCAGKYVSTKQLDASLVK